MMDSTNAIEINGLVKKYDGFTLGPVSFCVPEGSITGFIGQNGAGKSTTIKSILGIIKPDEGSINVLGTDVLSGRDDYRQYMAAVFDELPFNDELNSTDISRIFSRIYKNWSNETFFDYITKFELPRKKKCGKFSKGMKMKLQIAVALSHGAKLLVMDEATSGLDPVVRNEILDIFYDYLKDEGHSILMSSHITSDLDKIADNIVFIDHGRVYLTGEKDKILDSHGMVKCTKNEYLEIPACDFISARVTEFGVDVLISDRAAFSGKHPDMIIEKVSLEDVMLFYVNKEKKEWS
ncbi:MAG: ABC transporter ATP-binding protein [Clostridiales bacterium]|nr:ABC transporter ATP-binding protein [Clostridiales bacterium]